MFKQVTMIDVSDWDVLVTKTYGKVYSFQQQDGCKDRGTHHFSVPDKYPDDYENGTIPDKVNGREMGVSFKAWLERDPKVWYGGKEDSDQWGIDLFWMRNFYPDISMIANDLHAKGLLPAGDYVIDIDW